MREQIDWREHELYANSIPLYLDDMLICMVCDRAFTTARQLVQHQISKKHILCSRCDGLFDTPTQLKQHKDQEEHWSDTDTVDPNEERKESISSDEETECQTFSEIERLL